MALALCLTLLPTAALAEETENNVAVQANTANVAEVTAGSKTTRYTNIVDAFADAQKAESAAVKLLENVTIPKTADVYSYGIQLKSGNITLDLNGHTIQTTEVASGFVSLDAVFYIDDGSGLTVQDSTGGGKIVQPNGGQAIGVSSGNLTVKSGTIEVTSSDESNPTSVIMDKNCAVFLTGSGTANILDGTLTGKQGIYVKNGTLNVSGGTIHGKNSYAMWVAGGSVQLSGGTYTSTDTHSIWNADGTAASLLGSGYRYQDESGKESAYSDDTHGVVGDTTVAPRPANENAYIDKAGKLTTQANCTEITADTAKLTDSWYVVKENVTINGDLPVTGSEDVNLILCDGATLTISDALTVENDAVLNLYFQSNGTGKLTVGNSTGTVTAPAGEMKQTNDSSGTTFEKCLTHEWGYTVNEGDTHTATCRLCGKAEAAESHKYDSWAPTDANTHTGKCVCGAESTEQHTLTCTPNADGLTHSTKCSVCGYTAAVESHNFNQTDDYGTKCACGAYLAAEYNRQQYASLQAAINAAAADGGTVTLARDVSENVTVAGGTVTVDLNGNQWSASISEAANLWGHIPLTVTGGSVTLENGTLDQGRTTSAGSYGIRIQGGSVTVKGNAVVIGSNTTGSAANISYPAIILEDGDLTLETGATLVHGLKVPEGKHLSDYLPEGTAFGLRGYDESNGMLTGDKCLFADAYITNAYNIPNMALVVETHKHTFAAGTTKCECGFTCAQHDWSKKNGVCTVCGFACPHNVGATEAGGVWACDTCGQTVTAKVVAPDDSAITYYADGHLDNGNVKSGLYFAIKAAKTGSTVAALGGEYSGGYVTGGKTLTLDMSNGKTIDGILYVGDVGEKDSVNKLIVIGSAEISDVIVAPGDNTLDLTGWTGRIGSLTVQNGGKATLNGGTFATLNVNSATAGSLLASGYAFQNADTGAYVEYSSTADMENVKVVKCPHSGVKLKEDHTGAECKYCGASFAATLDDAPYGKIDAAVTDWLANGGTLKLFADYGQGADGNDLDLSSASAEWLTIDLNGHGFYKDCKINTSIKLSGGKALTITDSSGKGTGIFGPIDADRGTLTLESGHLDGLTVSSDSSATILLKGGKVSALACPVPVFNLLGNGYCLMSGNITVDPTTILNSGTGTYTIKNPQPLITADKKNGSSSKGERKIPFTLSLKANDSEVGRMQFKWYFIKEDGTTALLAESGDVTATTNDVFTYDATTQSKVAAGWDDTDLKVRDKPYDVICVVTGKDSNGAYLWQTPLRGYKLTIEQTDLKDLKLEFTQVEDTSGFAGPFKGNIKDGKGTFVFEPYGGDVGDASTLTYCFEVYLDGQELEKGKDYIIVDKSNEAKYAGAHTLTIQGMGDYKGTATHTWRIEPYQLTRENYDPPTITKVYDGTTGFDFSKDGNWGIFTENVAHRPNDEKTGKNPVLGSDGSAISIYLKPDDFKASAVTLDSPDAGDRTASFTIELKTRDGQREPNFAFEDGGSPTIQVTGAAASITKAPAPTGLANGALTVYNGTAKTYEIDIASLLPSPGAGCRYGKIYDSQTIGPYTYKTEITEIKLNSSYYDATANKAKIEKGKLILPIQNVNTTTTGKIGTIKLDVISQNYHQIKDWTIDVSAANQPVSSSGGGSGKTDRPGTVKTDTVTNPDGSVTKTETKSDGTVIETTTGKDGSTTKTETKKDGSSVTESKDAAGSTGTVKTDKHGQTTAETTLSSKAIETAKKSGEAVKTPVEVEASRDSNTAPTVKIELPKNSGDTKVEIPVTNVKPGTVAVLVHPDGTEEIVKNSLPTEDGIQLTVNGGATVKIVDNAKDFIDTQNHWAKDAINFVSARELVNGMSATIYAPDASATRAQLWTILARQNDADLNGGNTWYEKAQLWSKDKGISDGTEPDTAISRAQMVTMLWRTMGQPAAASGASFADVPADSYYAQAVAWAIENGITAGVGGGRFDPAATCTRAQIATFLYRTYQGK